MSENKIDVSQDALRIARSIDRLPLGEFMIRLVRRHERDGGMSAEIAKSEKVRSIGGKNGRDTD